MVGRGFIRAHYMEGWWWGGVYNAHYMEGWWWGGGL